ncbi:MAG: pyridoxal phosphate-dependent aminotransferase [Candidatus Sumerlaeia bacterium]|nr:pyridoxal phosphate-dependent aminotransferase [Candidatus Sumerlaeia bacterium]
MKISARVKSIAPSATLAVTNKANALKAQGVDVVGFGAGEPDFDTPDFIKEAAKKALDAGFTKYTPSAGTPELRKAIAEKFKKDNGIEYTPEQILVSCGAKHSIYNAVQTLVDPGDEVIFQAPYWVSYPEFVRAAGGTPVIIPAGVEQEFKMTADQVHEAITNKTTLCILNSPSNPTGAVYTKEELLAIMDVLSDHGVSVISDEIYEKLLYDGLEHVCVPALAPEYKESTILVNGVSKTYSMTGWRIGYLAGPKDVVAAMSRLQDHSTSNPTSISQRAALAALQGDQSIVQTMLKAFDERRRYMVGALNEIPGVRCPMPKGAFYVFPDVSGCYNKPLKGGKVVKTSFEMADYLLETARAAVVPGGAFGDDRCIRLSYATSLEQIKKGIERIAEALA